MKIQFGVLLLATLVLAGCENPQKAATTDANGQTVTTAAAHKKKCDATTGSRMGNCSDKGAPDVQGASGDDYRRANTAISQAPQQRKPN